MEPDDPATDPATRPVRPVDLRDHVRFAEEHATRVRVFATDHLAYDLWCLEPRQSTPVLHDPDRDATYTVIGGRSWFVTDQGEIGLDPLGAMLVPAGTVHGIDNRGADPLIVAAVSAPPSDDTEDAPPADLQAAITLPEQRRGVLQRLAEAFIGGDDRDERPGDGAPDRDGDDAPDGTGAPGGGDAPDGTGGTGRAG